MNFGASSQITLQKTSADVWRHSIVAKDEVVSTGEDVIIDMWANSGITPKFDEFWEVVSDCIAEKTALDDRRHFTVAEKEVVSTEEDVVIDIRTNNGKKHKFDEFWEVVSDYIA